jgi:competence protein ComEA
MTSSDRTPHPDRWASWLAATPAELVGLAVLLLGALVATGLLWWGAAQRPADLVTAAPAGPGTVGEAGAELVPGGPDEVHGGGGEVLGGADDDHAHEGTHAAGSPGDPSAPLTEVVVHVSGAVARPGLVTLRVGARVGDAIEAAGGAVDGADPARLNLARPLEDGEHVHLPREGEEPLASWDGDGRGGPATEADGGSGRIDLNRASATELETLPGIGPAKAAAIVDHRERHGPFRVPGDLREVPGIGERTFQQLAELVTVS